MQKENKKNDQIVSFNVDIPELPTLIELDEEELEQVAGGVPPTCPNLTSCGIFF